MELNINFTKFGQVNSGAWQQLKDNLALAKTKRPQELGVDGAALPDGFTLNKIRQKFLSMRKTYSPEKKVSLLLRVCKLIYSIMQDNSGVWPELDYKHGSIDLILCCFCLTCVSVTYRSVGFLPGRMYGADDFLPMLTYIVAQCDVPQLDMEVEYMMELLDPSLLQGEGRLFQASESPPH